MADRKITDLTALAAGSQATGDLLTIVDVSESAAADKNKKITVESLFKGIPPNVGIGTSSPGRQLQINGDSDTQIRVVASAGGAAGIQFGDANDSVMGGVNFDASDDSLQLRGFNNSERLRINSSGNVGIGTTTPQHRLSVERDIGIYRASSDPTLSLSVGGTISSPTKTYSLLIDDSDSDKLQLRDGSTARVTLDGSGNVGIGTTSPTTSLHIKGANITGKGQFVVSSDSAGQEARMTFIDGSDDIAEISTDGDNFYFYNERSSGAFQFYTGGTERLRIDSSGRVGIGTSSPDQLLTVNGGVGINNSGGGGGSPILTITNNSGNPFINCTSNSTALTFGYNSTERMRITSDGDLLIGQSSTDTPGFGNTTLGAAFENLGADGAALFVSRSNNICAGFNRAQDGTVVQFASAGTVEGSISISGTTTSYNGAHLARWTQLAGNAERIEILRGSVLSNIDEMCEWGEEDNEQLNRMKVSDVEGDVNVSGVFQAWDDDDDTYTNDFYCAMTGDFVIRIAQGTTVARGDLLMSAGDGTAKPQDDDIVRSKTIAKVTSTTVSTTYADGSYCVPCVLMAC